MSAASQITTIIETINVSNEHAAQPTATNA